MAAVAVGARAAAAFAATMVTCLARLRRGPAGDGGAEPWGDSA